MADKDERLDVAGEPNLAERESETGKYEYAQLRQASGFDNWASNQKRLFDEMLGESLETTRLVRSHLGVILTNAESHNQALREKSLQATQNAVETANMVGKRALDYWARSADHHDVATDRTWNQDEVSALTAKTGAQQDLVQAIAAAVTAGILAAQNKT